MRLTIRYKASVDFLPTRRHRIPRRMYTPRKVDVEIPEVTAEDFPVAMVTRTFRTVYEDAACVKDFERMDGERRIFSEEYRAYRGRLFKPVRVARGHAVSLIWRRPQYIVDTLERCVPERSDEDDMGYSKRSVIISSSEEKDVALIRRAADRYLLYDGSVWETCGEPMYMLSAFGMGRNLGGTNLFVTEDRDGSRSTLCYFNALNRDQAVKYGRKVAECRGDTESVAHIGDGAAIDVMMPEMVKRDPKMGPNRPKGGISRAERETCKAGLF